MQGLNDTHRGAFLFENKDFSQRSQSAPNPTMGLRKPIQERRIQMATIEPDTPRSHGDRNAPHATPATPAEDMRTVLINRVSWGAVAAGVVVALVVQLILNMLGIGLGAATFDPTAGNNPTASSFSIGAGIWWALSGIIAALIGGYTAGRLAGQARESSGAWHGLISWALTTLLVFYLLTTTLGTIVGGAFRAVGGAAAGAAQTLGATAQTAVQAAAPGLANTADPFASIEQRLRDASGGTDPAALRDAAISAVRALVTADPQQQQDARERAAQAIAKAQSIAIDQARSRLAEYEQQYRQTIDQAKQKGLAAADIATKTVSRGALFGAIALILGAIAAWFGGRMGAVDPTLTSPALMRSQRRLH
jgi:hypothetical protein